MGAVGGPGMNRSTSTNRLQNNLAGHHQGVGLGGGAATGTGSGKYPDLRRI